MKTLLLNLLIERGYSTITEYNSITFSNDIYTIKLIYTQSELNLVIDCINSRNLMNTITIENQNLNLNKLRNYLIKLSESLPPNSYLRGCYDDLSNLIEEYLLALFLKETC